ncbi:MAG: PQQ-binding-like beta-propeller repeat protein [Pirellula sp.]
MENLSDPKSGPTSETPVSRFRPLRIWIPLLLLLAMAVARFIPDWVQNAPSWIWMVSAFGPLLIGLVVVLWWLLVSRARWYERLLGVAGIVGAVAIEQVICDPSMRGPLLMVMTIPMAIAAFAIGAILYHRTLSSRRTWIAVALAFLAASVSALLKTDGVWGDFSFGLDWRWNASSEDRLLASRSASGKSVDAASIDTAAFRNPEWPGFRGANGDGTQRGKAFSSDWTARPPKELWRIPVGPAWSSFAIAGDYLFTQEQRGEQESVVCYDTNTGKQLWEHGEASRFFEALGGLGPRATPAIAGGFIYALGAEGWLMKIDAANGELAWKIDLKKEADREPPMWGFSSSPCVHDGLVIVHAGSKGDKGVLAFRAEDGKLAWSASAGEMSYGSVQPVQVFGKTYLALLSDTGAHFWKPDTGETGLEYDWKHQGYRALQPRILEGNQLLIPTGLGSGTRLVQLKEVDGKLEGEEVWTSINLKPDFNDLIVHDGYAYGFDNAIFTCIDLKDGARKWKGGRYQKGQAMLLADSGLIVVVSEPGELVLLRATPESLQEIYKAPAMNGKTWNHPAVVGDKLYLRNGEEAVCYELPPVKN